MQKRKSRSVTKSLIGFPFYMVRWEGVEPPTTWFVARYSIQLSYQRNIGGGL